MNHEFRDGATIAIGAYMGAAGFTLNESLRIQQAYTVLTGTEWDDDEPRSFWYYPLPRSKRGKYGNRLQIGKITKPILSEVTVHKYLARAGRIAGVSWVVLIGGMTLAAVLFIPVYMLIDRLRPPGDHWSSADCDRGPEIQPAASPNGSFVARGIYLQCGGPLANTAADLVVIVKNGQDPTPDDEVFSGDWGYMSQTTTKLVWKGEKVLEITLPDDALIYKKKASLGDIAIQVKFESDDPQIRETALRERERRVKEALAR